MPTVSSMSTSPRQQCTLTVSDGEFEVQVEVPSALRQAAIDSAHRFTAAHGDQKSEGPADLAGKLLRFLLDDTPTAHDVDVAAAVLSMIVDQFCEGNDVHCVQGLSAEATRALVRTVYDASAVISDRVEVEPYCPRPSRLVSSVEDGVFGLFGGQGTGYIGELGELHRTYAPLVGPLLERLSRVLRDEASSDEAVRSKMLLHGLEPMGWASGDVGLPPDSYLSSAPVSLPMVGLTQLCQYAASCRVLGMTPGQMRERMCGVAGHSQGIVAAVAVASAETWDELAELSERAVRLLFWLGLRAQQAHPVATLDPRVIADSVEHAEGTPQPMMAVMSLPLAQAEKAVEEANQFLSDDRRLVVSLVNGPAQVVVSGPRESVHGLNVMLRKLKGAASVDQSRVPFSNRKIAFHTQYLAGSVPFHSPYLAAAVPAVKRDVERLGLDFGAAALRIPVMSTDTGRDLREVSGSLAGDIVEQVCLRRVEWPAVCKRMRATHLVDFGPGGGSGLGNLTHRNVEGSGMCVIVASGPASSAKFRSRGLQPGAALYNRLAPPPRGADWGREYAPKLVRCKASGKLHIETRFSKLIGRPPVMVAGMTPWTMPAELNAAVINAGYHIEISGGGHFTRQMMTEKIHKIQDLVQPGQHVSVNMLYLNAFLWNQQYPLLVELRSKGVPVEGCTVAAGVPTPEKAKEIVQACMEAGMKHISFKPGSEDAIRQVCDIAERNPSMGIILQWTGGRGGGHHSFEDQHDPILRTYPLMRRLKNLALVVGSGFGDDAASFPWLTGEWSARFGRPRMPFDGILIATRMGAAKEAATSPACKDLLVEAAGIPEDDQHLWERSYTGPVGGITTVTSELGEPIHKVANRGILLWKELDETVFSLPREKQMAAISQKRDYIIRKLNADYQKPYFGAKLSGQPCEVSEMTYEEVVRRLVALLYFPAKGSPAGAPPTRWIDPSMRAMTAKWMRRVEERFTTGSAPSLLPTDAVLDTPFPFIESFLDHYPLTRRQLLCTEDVHFFMGICGFPAQKPVPFVPALDERFVSWFKKDSLWQSEDVDGVYGRDAQRVAILAGPVAVHYIKKADEPAKDILDGIYHGWIQRLQAADAPVTDVEWFGCTPQPVAAPTKLITEEADGAVRSFALAEAELPSAEQWLDRVTGDKLSWLKALLCSPDICSGTGRRSRYVSNPLRRVFAPRPGQRAQLRTSADGEPQELTFFDSAVIAGHPVAEIRLADAGAVAVSLYDPGLGGEPAKLELRYKFLPGLCPSCPIHEDVDDRSDRVKSFYAKLWMGPLADEVLADTRKPWELTGMPGGSFTVTREAVTDFCRIVGNDHREYLEGLAGSSGKVKAPMDIAIVAGWRATVRALFSKSIDGDLLKLVHLGNSFKMLRPGQMFQEGDTVDSRGDVTAVTNDAAGNKVVEVTGTLSRSGDDVCEIKSRFLYRGAAGDWPNTFRRSPKPPVVVTLADQKLIAVVKSKTWVTWEEPDYLIEGTDLTFHTTDTMEFFRAAGGYSALTVSGHVTVELSTREVLRIGTVHFDGKDCAGDPVATFLKTSGKAVDESKLFEHGGTEMDLTDVPDAVIQCPKVNTEYSAVSGDCNPIHTNQYISSLAGLPGTIVHGMWTSAAVRNLVETFAADNNPQYVAAYSVDFLGMVLPGDRLTTTLNHAGMTEGRRLINILTKNQDGQTIIKGTAEVEEPTTAYVFTGQGSQSKGMGMELYEKSAVAKAVWDQADDHLRKTYGFSILKIVRENPSEMTVHFGGKHGAQIRENYRGLVYETQSASGETKALQLFPTVKSESTSFTFRQPDGLLNATQFTQPALTLMQVSAFRDMEAKGLVQQDTLFAGHSLGEYSALAALVEVLPVESLVDVVFYRGMTMQVAVPRDSMNRSEFGMVAVSPLRVGDGFDEAALEFVVSAIAKAAGLLLEIVNFNVVRQQYVCSGHLLALDTLGQLLNFIRTEKLNVTALIKKLGMEKMKEHLAETIQQVLARCKGRMEANSGRPVIERGLATIPLPGIDVPFHSSYLLGGVSPFREVLRSKIRLESIDVAALRGRYVPNLVAQPFQTTREFVQLVQDTSQSPVLAKVLSGWKERLNAAELQLLGYQILIELLAYQFASPVRWIETQQVLFGEDHVVRRMIEVGPEPTLTTMADRTLKAVYEKHDQASSTKRVLLHVVRNRSELYYEAEPAQVPVVAAMASKPDPLVVVPAAVAAPTAAPAPAPAAAAPAPAVGDAPPAPLDIVRAICALKLRKPLQDVQPSQTIKQMAGGKSTLQNEILGDLANEFPGFQGDKVEDEPLSAIAGQMKASGLGKITTAVVNKMVSAKMPGGFGMTQLKAYLSEGYGLGAGRTSGVLLHAATMEPASRLSGDSQAKAWLDGVVAAYSAAAGVPLQKGGAAPAAAPAAAAVAAPAAAAAPASVPDAAVTALEFLRILVAAKLKREPSAAVDGKSIKELVGGKSTMQNEILGDLGAEFGDAASTVDSAAEIPIAEVAAKIPRYSGLGKWSQKAVQRLVSSTMPGSFGMSAVRANLSAKGLGAGRTDGVLLHALAIEPAARLGSDDAARAYWDSVLASYAALNKVTVGGGGAVAAGGGGGGAVVSSAEVQQLRLAQETLAREQMALLASYLKEDPREGWHMAETAQERCDALLAENDAIRAELGDVFLKGIQPQFSAKKVRTYTSFWNWVRVDIILFFQQMLAGKITKEGLSNTQRRQVHHVMNRANKSFFEFISFNTKVALAKGGQYFDRSREAGYTLAKEVPAFAPVWMLDAAVSDKILSLPPLFVPVGTPSAPKTDMSSTGKVSYREVDRLDADGKPCSGYRDYAVEVAKGIDLARILQTTKMRKGLVRLQSLSTKRRVAKKEISAILDELGLGGALWISEDSETDPDAALLPKREKRLTERVGALPLLYLSQKNSDNKWEYSKPLTQVYLSALTDVVSTGVTFAGKVAVVNGANRGSICSEIMKGLLAGGAQVVVLHRTPDTRNYSDDTKFYRKVYEEWGSKGSKLWVLPFNGGSAQDCESCMSYVYDVLQLDVDYVLPFAAVPQMGIEATQIGSQSELALRVMLTNIYRLIGAVARRKERMGQTSRPAMCVLPLSPNHGTFGGDGFYAESKIGLEPLFNKWESESWGRYLSVVGAAMGWVRGTGLMSVNNIVAEGMEKMGLRTFSQLEMAINCLSLMHPMMVKVAEREPVYADFCGGLQLLPNVSSIASNLRSTIREVSDVRAAVAAAADKEAAVLGRADPQAAARYVEARANMRFDFPALPSYAQLVQDKAYLKGMVDLEQVVVCTGYGEVGPWGNARTRWEMEASGEFSLEGCIELAWIMGLIKYERSREYTGWVGKDGQKLKDSDVKRTLEKDILAHTGIRFVEPELFDGYDPQKKSFLHQIQLDHDMAPVECGEEEARAFKAQHGDSVDVWPKSDGIWAAKLKRGASIYLPKSLSFTRLVAGQIPTGWDAARYGVPKDICEQVDPVTLYNLVSTVEALTSSGITDPYEFYKYVHVSEVGNTSGGGVGGLKASEKIFRRRYLDQSVQNDILQEMFINTMPAWVNMLLLSSSGPIKTPVGACATAAESVEVGVETILSGKAKVVICGGYDDFGEDASYEFANMKATSNAVDEMAAGREPKEMSRPSTSSRAGFMESQGAGSQVLMSAAVAIEMGVPIYGIVALTNTATDRQGRSVPAPGQGILTTAREMHCAVPPRELDMQWRMRELGQERAAIARWVQRQHETLQQEVERMEGATPSFNASEYTAARLEEVQRGAKRREKAALDTYGQGFYKGNLNIAPIRGALGVWGLDVDDLSVGSFHGTSTQANDFNESDVLNAQLRHLGRSPGNPLPCVMQKWLTGHPKGAAAAWMLNGCLQMMGTGTVPGNRNADDVDERLQQFGNLYYPSRTMTACDVKACLLKSFGFGQAGGEVLLLHPSYVLATLDEAEYAAYGAKVTERQAKTYRRYHDSLTDGKLVHVKDDAPYTRDQQQSVYLDPTARATWDGKQGTYSFHKYVGAKRAEKAENPLVEAQRMLARASHEQKGVGCDVELLSGVPIDSPTFVSRNYTAKELDECRSQANFRGAMAGKWAAKEAVIKAISSHSASAAPLWKGAGAPVKQIEVLTGQSGAPLVHLCGAAHEAAQKAGVSEVSVTITACGAYAIAIAQAC